MRRLVGTKRCRNDDEAQRQREDDQKRSPGDEPSVNPPMYAPLYPGYGNIWITEGSGRSHARPLVGRKGGREPPLIQIFAYKVMVFP